jgi:hypothetical protein
MIYELRTYDLKTRRLGEFEKRFEEALEKRSKYSPLGAFWHSEIGLLNQVVQVWPYDSLDECVRVRAAVDRDKVWPAQLAECVLEAHCDLMSPLAISPPLAPCNVGPYFEMRTYTYVSGELPTLINNWEKAIDVRLPFGPVTALWISVAGALNKFVHIWPYRTLNDRMDIRHQAEATGLYPPNIRALKEGGRNYELHRQENKILMPAKFSPVQ